MSRKQYNEVIANSGFPAAPYIIVDGHGYDSANPELVRRAFDVQDAVKLAQAAIKIPEKWAEATAALQEIAPFEEAVPLDNPAAFVAGGRLNLPAIADSASRLASACSVAAMYHDPTTHNCADKLSTMATASSLCKPFHIIDHGRLASRHAIVTCENAFAAATDALKTVDTDPHGAAAAYQQNIALASVAYSYIEKSMVSAELKASRYAVDERIAASYPDTYPAIMKTVSAAYVPAGV